MNVIDPAAVELLQNKIIRNSSIIDWGKQIARCNEIIQKNLLCHCGVPTFDPADKEDTNITIANNSPGFDMISSKTQFEHSLNSKGLPLNNRCKHTSFVRIQSKLRQVTGSTPFSRQTHFETTRRHSKKNEGSSSNTGHVAYSLDEFDYVMISLVHIKDSTLNRHIVDNWAFSIIPITELIDADTGCCKTRISSFLLKKYEYKINPSTI